MLPTGTEILWLVALPAVLAAAVVLAARPWRRGRDLPGWAAAGAIAGAFAVAFAGFYQTPRFPPVSAEAWLVWLGVPVLAAAVLQAVVRSTPVAVSSSAIVLLAAPWLLLRKLTFLEPAVLWAWVGGAGVVMVAWWIAMEALARRTRGGSLPLLLGIVVGLAGLTIINAHSRQLGMLTGGVAIPLFVVAAAATWAGGASLARGGALAIAVLLFGLLLAGRFFADLSLLDLTLLALAPLAAWAGELPRLGRPDSWRRVLVRSIAVLAVVGFTAVTTLAGLQRTMQEQTESYSY